MKLKQQVVVLTLLSGLACASRAPTTTDVVSPPSSEPVALTVLVLGLNSADGEVALALFDSAESFKQRTHAVATGRVSPRDGTAAWQVVDLQPGTYALAVYHDLNENGKLDRSTLGPPDEPYGFSNDARGTFGPPKFSSAAIEIGPADLSIEVRLK